MKKKKVVKMLNTSGKNEMTALVDKSLPSDIKKRRKRESRFMRL